MGSIALTLSTFLLFASTVDGQNVDVPPQSIRLESMPDIPPRRPRTARKYRTPFIVPISPPHFGTIEFPIQDTRVRSVSRSASRGTVATYFAEPLPSSFAIQLPPAHAASIATRPAKARFFSTLIAHSEADTNGSGTSKTVSAAGPNVRAIEERIALHNLSVAAIEDQLRTQDTWTLAELESIYSQLQAIKASRDIWSLYLDIVPARKRRQLPTPQPLSNSADQLGQRIFETQVALDINPFAVTRLNASQAKQRLKEIKRNVTAFE